MMSSKMLVLSAVLVVALVALQSAGQVWLGVAPVDGETVYADTKARYAATNGYRQSCTWSITPLGDASSSDLFMYLTDGEHRSQLLFSRPDCLALIGEDRQWYTDGETVWMVDPESNRYSESVVSDDLDIRSWFFFFPRLDPSFMQVVPHLLEGEGSACRQEVEEPEFQVGIETIDGVACYRLSWGL